MTKKQELATVTEETLPTTAVQSAQSIMSEWGDVVVESKDFIMAKYLLMQASSAGVKEKKAAIGDYFNTLTEQVVSDKDGKVEVLPFFCKQSYTIEKWNGKKFEFHKSIDYSGQQLPFEEEIMGVRYKNTHVYEFFCLTPDGGVPVIVPFKSTSHSTGKKLFNIMYVQNPQMGKAPPANWMTLSTAEASNKDGDQFYVMEVNPSRATTKPELDECLKWIPTVKQANFRTAEEKPSQAAEVKETRF